jgi:hypothetical protein
MVIDTADAALLAAIGTDTVPDNVIATARRAAPALAAPAATN